MPTHSSAISDNDFTNPQQRPTPPLQPKPRRPKEFWEAEPGDTEALGWRDDPTDNTAPQLGSIANPKNPADVSVGTNADVKPPNPAPVPTPQVTSNVTITPTQSFRGSSNRADNPKWLEYLRFVDAVTSEESKNGAQFIARVAQLQGGGCNIERLLTAAVGISAEGGEFLEIVKKIAFQGKPYDDASINHLKVELGDVLWYVAQACMALNVPLDEVLAQNITKLSSRYPEGTFSSYFSENRRIDDL